jgi:predicted transcriptional regulator
MEDRSMIPPALHELETEVMEEVWKRPISSVREVMEAVNRRAPTPRAYTTYMTTMARLDSKGLLERTREGKADLYRPLYSSAEYADLRAQAGADSLVEQFGELALGHFARQISQLDPNRRRSLQRLARKK